MEVLSMQQKHSIRLFFFLISGATAVAITSDLLAQQPVAQVQIVADGMCCNGCAQKVGAQLYTAPGVSNVQADVPNRLVTITFRPSPKLTLGGIWAATERADGKPSKLMTTQATYTLQRPEQLQLSEPLHPGRYWIVVEKLTSDEEIEKAIKQLRVIRGVKSANCDRASRTFFVETAPNEVLSPWVALGAMEQSGHTTQSVMGPYGLFSIERVKERAVPVTAAQQQQQQQQGSVR